MLDINGGVQARIIIRAHYALYPSYSGNGCSKDFLMYDRDAGGLLVILVTRRCVNGSKNGDSPLGRRRGA